MIRENASVAVALERWHVVAVPLFPGQPCTGWVTPAKFHWKLSKPQMASVSESTTSRGSRTDTVVQTMNESEGGGV